jgi:hypothetical protein
MGMIVASLLCFDLQQEASAESSSKEQGVKRALLIGINKYEAVPKLQGSLNDIETMRQVLITRWGFPENHIALLTNEAATRAGMLAAMEQLVKEAGPNDTVYFHFSGHGSQVEDTNGDEKDDGLDETLVPQDGRTGDVRDITDDELDAIFARLRSKTAFIVLDSCHSGTATRSLDIRTRSIPRDPRVDIYRTAEAALPKTRAIVPVVSSRYVVMTGAASHQEALDGPVDGRYHGFFTFALARSLGSSSPDASPREVFQGVERELKRIQIHFGRSSMPEPQLEAPPELLEQSLLGSARNSVAGQPTTQSTRLAWLEVRPADGDSVTLINGPLLGATPGSTWAIYPPGELTFAPGRAIAAATATQITGRNTIAKLHTAAKIPAGSRATALLPAPPGEKVSIRILDVPNDRRKQIEDVLLRSVKDIALVTEDKPARFLVDTEGTHLRLLAADGLQVIAAFPLEGEQWGVGLAQVVTRSANASELLTLDNPSSQLKITVRVANAPQPAKPKISTRGIAVVAADTQPAKYRIRKSGKPRTEQNSLQLEVKVNSDSYVTIVDVDSEGGVNLLFPNNYQHRNFYGDGFIRGNETVLIPDSIRTGNKAGFYWDYSPPKGTDTIRVFTSTDLQTAQMIRDRIKALQASTDRAEVQVKTRSIAQTIQSLRNSLGSMMARGIITVSDSTSHIPGEIAATPMDQPAAPTSPAAMPTPETVAPPIPDATPPASMATSSDPSLVAASTPADWAATSVTILISE